MKFIPVFALLLSVIAANAQNEGREIIQDPAAEPFLEQISSLFNPGSALQLEFRYEVETPDPPSKVADNGSIIIKGDKYKLSTEDGEMYFNGKNLWVYNKSAAEVYKSVPEGESMDEMLLSPFRLIKEYRKYYKYSLKNDVTVTGTVYAQIELYPMDLQTSYSIMRVLVNRKTGAFYSFSMQQKNGVIYTIYSKDIIKNIKIPESTFSWDKAANPDVLEVTM